MERNWLEQQLADNGFQVTREDELLAKIIELEDRCLVLEDQVSHARWWAEYWRHQAGTYRSSNPFSWEE